MMVAYLLLRLQSQSKEVGTDTGLQGGGHVLFVCKQLQACVLLPLWHNVSSLDGKL